MFTIRQLDQKQIQLLIHIGKYQLSILPPDLHYGCSNTRNEVEVAINIDNKLIDVNHSLWAEIGLETFDPTDPDFEADICCTESDDRVFVTPAGLTHIMQYLGGKK